MRLKIRDGKDFSAGLFFSLIGIVTVLQARDYTVGTARSMGPGYFPLLLGSILLLIGAATTIRGLLRRGEPIAVGSLRPFLVSAAVVAFAFLLKPGGLIAALLALVLVSALASREFRLRDTLMLYIVLAALATGLFVYTLGLPLALFWS
jgi:hypothetical protein